MIFFAHKISIYAFSSIAENLFYPCQEANDDYLTETIEAACELYFYLNKSSDMKKYILTIQKVMEYYLQHKNSQNLK